MEAATGWHDWPEKNLYEAAEGAEWKVFPFVFTFPSNDPSKTVWLDSQCERCPETARILRSIPGVRTALYSRMGPNTILGAHSGWAELSNHVLRCHIPLSIPAPRTSGLSVVGGVRYHEEGKLVMFDDSRVHLGFNLHETSSRCALIVDVARPDWAPPGKAKGAKTKELMQYIQLFLDGGDADKCGPREAEGKDGGGGGAGGGDGPR